MCIRLLFLFLVSHIVFVHCQDEPNLDVPETDKVVGVKTVHDVKVDKDTVISTATLLEMEQKIRKKDIKLEQEETEESEEIKKGPIYNQIPAELSDDVTAFKRNLSECLREVQANDKRTVQRLSPAPESPVHGECLIACVFKRNGVIENGKINKDNLIALVTKFYAKEVKMLKKLENNLDRCVELATHNKDDCSLAAKLNECTNGLMTVNKHKITVNY